MKLSLSLSVLFREALKIGPDKDSRSHLMTLPTVISNKKLSPSKGTCSHYCIHYIRIHRMRWGANHHSDPKGESGKRKWNCLFPIAWCSSAIDRWTLDKRTSRPEKGPQIREKEIDCKYTIVKEMMIVLAKEHKPLTHTCSRSAMNGGPSSFRWSLPSILPWGTKTMSLFAISTSRVVSWNWLT